MDPTAWSKKASIFANKKKVMEGMLTFQKNGLHHPMTHTAVGSTTDKREIRTITKAAKHNFEVLKKFMGQAKTVRMPQRLDECFIACQQHKGNDVQCKRM